MIVEEECLKLFLESCDGLSGLGGGWQLTPPERKRKDESLGE